MNKIFTLQNQDIHIWNFNIEQDLEYFSQYQSILDSPTLSQTKGFYHLADRTQALLSAIISRLLLANYLDIIPGLVKLKYN